MEYASLCLTGSRLMTTRGIKGQKTLGAMCISASVSVGLVYVLICLSVYLHCRRNMKDGNLGWGGGGGVV